MSTVMVHRKSVIAVFEDLRHTADAGGSDFVSVSDLFSSLSAILPGGKIKILSGSGKGKVRVILTQASNKITFSAIVGADCDGADFVISPPSDAASLRKFCVAGTSAPTPGMDATVLPQDMYRGHIGQDAMVNTRTLSRFAFTTPLKGSGAAATPADWARLLKAASMTEAITSDVAYTPNSTDTTSVTMYMWKDDQRFASRFLKCSPVFDFTTGEFGEISIDTLGLWEAPVADTNPTTTGISATKGIPIQNATTTIGTHHMTLLNMSFAVSNGLEPLSDAEADQSFADVRIPERDPRMTLTVYAPKLATQNYFASLAANTLAALAINIGDTAGNRIAFAAPKAQVVSISEGDENGVITYSIELLLTADSGNDEFTITTS